MSEDRPMTAEEAADLGLGPVQRFVIDESPQMDPDLKYFYDNIEDTEVILDIIFTDSHYGRRNCRTRRLLRRLARKPIAWRLYEYTLDKVMKRERYRRKQALRKKKMKKKRLWRNRMQ